MVKIIGNIFLLFTKYLEVKIMSAILVNSLGCIPKLPMPNQLLLPFLTVPIPGINTNISNIMQAKSILLEYL